MSFDHTDPTEKAKEVVLLKGLYADYNYHSRNTTRDTLHFMYPRSNTSVILLCSKSNS